MSRLPEYRPIEEIPLADVPAGTEGPDTAYARRARFWGPVFTFLSLDLCILHIILLVSALGGIKGLTNGWPIWRDDHPLYLHSALITRSFLQESGTTAGYDPAFMSGYAKSVVFPSSSTLPELVHFFFQRFDPFLVYKFYVLITASLVPFLIYGAIRIWGGDARASFFTLLPFLLYLWSDFPISYVTYGMLPYFLAVPLALLTTGFVCKYLEKGGLVRWGVSAVFSALTLMVHLTTAMIVIPAVAAAYLASLIARNPDTPRLPISRHVGLWLLPIMTLVANAFWWLPGYWLADTKGPSGFAFAHAEGVWRRFLQILTTEPPAQSFVIGLGLGGLAAVTRRSRPLVVGLLGFTFSGFFWGYLAGAFRGLDFLQPGRHTYAFYSGMAIFAGLGLDEVLRRLRGAKVGRLDLLVGAGLILASLRIFIPVMEITARPKVDGDFPMLYSEPPYRLKWLLKHVKTHVQPGERLLYEEGGFAVNGLTDPFGPARFSGLLPNLFPIELIGGPYLHASLATNFTQFGEGELFGKKDWGRDYFERYARLYRPAAIICWSPRAREFCRANPDLIEIKEDDGVVLIARVKGFEGATIRGSAKVETRPGKLIVSEMKPGVDGLVVLRYHSVPYLRVDPPCPTEEVRLEDDPVPFIGLRPQGDGPVTIELVLPSLRKSVLP